MTAHGRRTANQDHPGPADDAHGSGPGVLPPPGRRGQRQGIALVTVVLALVVIETALAGALFICSLEATTTRALGLRMRVGYAAESGLAAALAHWDAAAVAQLRQGETLAVALPTLPTPAAADARIERLTANAYLVTARGRLIVGDRTAAIATAAAIVGWHEPSAFSASAPAALVAGGTVRLGPAARVDGLAPTTGCPAESTPVRAPIDSLAAATFRPAAGIASPAATPPHLTVGAIVLGVPPIGTSTLGPAGFTRLGPVDLARLAAAADRTETGAITLSPTASPHGCDGRAPGNWGAPAAPLHPCAGFLPLVHAPSGLTIRGGLGAALLLVDGDLLIEAGAEVHGVIVVTGRADVRGRVRGVLRVAGDATIQGEVSRDPCAIWRALTSPHALARPFRRTHRWRLPHP
jgi:hypothetical protein